jgi:hypothetical protein
MHLSIWILTGLFGKGKQNPTQTNKQNMKQSNVKQKERPLKKKKTIEQTLRQQALETSDGFIYPFF